MALSGTRDEATTVADVISDAMTKVNLLVAGESVDASDQAVCLRNLRNMLRTWAAKGVRLWLTQDQTITPVAATSSYALTIRALEVTQGWRRTDSLDTPLTMYSREQYNRLPAKSASGSPFLFYVDRDLTATNVVVYPVPDATSAANDVLHFTCKVQIQDVTDSAETIEVPAEWMETLVYNLAVRIAPDFEVTPRPDVVQMAQMLYADLEGQDRECSLFMRPSRHG